MTWEPCSVIQVSTRTLWSLKLAKSSPFLPTKKTRATFSFAVRFATCKQLANSTLIPIVKAKSIEPTSQNSKCQVSAHCHNSAGKNILMVQFRFRHCTAWWRGTDTSRTHHLQGLWQIQRCPAYWPWILGWNYSWTQRWSDLWMLALQNFIGFQRSHFGHCKRQTSPQIPCK